MMAPIATLIDKMPRSSTGGVASDRPARASRVSRSTKPAVRAALSPADWIDAATELLITKSIDAVRVDALARKLGVTRGSFYWHFRDRADLLRRMLEAWRNTQTEQLIDQYRRRGESPVAVIHALIELPFHGRAAIRGSSIELAIRAWARRDDAPRSVVDDVDRKRMAYIEECFMALGFEPDDARPRAFVLYGYLQSEALFRRSMADEADKAARRRFIAEALLSGANTQAERR